MKKTHFLNLEFQPGDFCWAIHLDTEKSEAAAVKLQVIKVVHTIELGAPKEKETLANYIKQLFYVLSDGSTILEPLRTKEEAESIIRKEIGKIALPSR